MRSMTSSQAVSENRKSIPFQTLLMAQYQAQPLLALTT